MVSQCCTVYHPPRKYNCSNLASFSPSLRNPSLRIAPELPRRSTAASRRSVSRFRDLDLLSSTQTQWLLYRRITMLTCRMIQLRSSATSLSNPSILLRINSSRSLAKLAKQASSYLDSQIHANLATAILIQKWRRSKVSICSTECRMEIPLKVLSMIKLSRLQFPKSMTMPLMLKKISEKLVYKRVWIYWK